jgi:hypothetical protein
MYLLKDASWCVGCGQIGREAEQHRDSPDVPLPTRMIRVCPDCHRIGWAIVPRSDARSPRAS